MLTECWVWEGGTNGHGYGRTTFQGKRQQVHRLVYEAWHDVELTPDVYVLHRCDNPPCYNPYHLFVGDQGDNMRDMADKRRQWQQKKTHCPKGHEYTLENTEWYNGWRYCWSCRHP